jgi:hypothetical protein
MVATSGAGYGVVWVVLFFCLKVCACACVFAVLCITRVLSFALWCMRMYVPCSAVYVLHDYRTVGRDRHRATNAGLYTIYAGLCMQGY